MQSLFVLVFRTTHLTMMVIRDLAQLFTPEQASAASTVESMSAQPIRHCCDLFVADAVSGRWRALTELTAGSAVSPTPAAPVRLPSTGRCRSAWSGSRVSAVRGRSPRLV